MEIDFEFQKERKIGDFVQSFIDLFKLVYKHFVATIFGLSAIPIGLMVLIYYFLSTKITFSANSNSFEDIDGYMWVGILVIGIGGLALYVCGISIEYFILLKERKNLDFAPHEVFGNFRANIRKYLYFFFGMLLALVVVFIPLVIACLVIMLIPFLGSFGIGILGSVVSVWLFCAFMTYREGYADLGDCFTTAYMLISKKLFQYGVSAYIISFLFQLATFMLSVVPMIILGVLSYNFLDINAAFFDSMAGKLLMTLGGAFLTVFTLFLYMSGILASGIIYETAKDLRYGERVYRLIESIGGEDV